METLPYFLPFSYLNMKSGDVDRHLSHLEKMKVEVRLGVDATKLKETLVTTNTNLYSFFLNQDD